MLCYHKKSRHNLYEQLDYLGLNPYEQRHFCFGGAGSGASGEDGGMGDSSADDADSMDSGTGPGNDGLSGGPTGGIDVDATFDGLSDFDPSFGMGVDLGSAFGAASRDAAEQASRAQSKALGLTEEEIASLYQGLLEDPMNFSPSTDTYSKQFRQRYPKYNPTALLQDPVQMLPQLDNLIDRDTAKELSATYLDMLKEAGIEAAAMDPKTKDERDQKEGLMETIQNQLNTGLLSDYYKDFAPMNELEKAGYRTFGTGYRGEFEARAPKALSREAYDPETLMASGIGPRSETLALFSQFAKENPAMTAMEALSAFNAVGSFGTLSEADLGMLGYSPNQAVGPQADFTENAREEGFYQGLGMLARAATGPSGMFGVVSDMALSGTNTSLFGSILDGLNNATKGDTGVGIVDEVSSIYDEVTGPVSEAFDTAAANFGSFVDSNVNNVVDFFSPEEEAAYNPAIGMADPAFEGRAGVSYTGSPFSGLPSDTFENYTNALAGLEEAERAEAISGVPADPSMGLADPAFAVQGQLQPGSFFSGMTPEQVESYVNTVSTPESTKRYVQRTPAPVSVNTPVVENTFIPASELTSNFFPETDLPNDSRFAELAQIYGPLRAQQLLGLA